ncbi:hypothetical protein XELAEV_18001277mg [Xenopus laevis]|uniref:Uncharacterized protein n=1 Tax=Xenopus laevis TaxID=8355 RepID=A0A974BPC6_XENLA|nr:hypothetical protein XELAEV_18001277mg [Xenopus laevis]
MFDASEGQCGSGFAITPLSNCVLWVTDLSLRLGSRGEKIHLPSQLPEIAVILTEGQQAIVFVCVCV